MAANILKDCEAYRLRGNEQGWQIVGSIESKGRPGLGEMREESALNMFRQMDLKGKSKDDTQLKTVHQNTIATIRAFEVSGAMVKKFSCEYLQRYRHGQLLTLHSERGGWQGRYLVYMKRIHLSRRTPPRISCEGHRCLLHVFGAYCQKYKLFVVD